jgi:hypothetical protein
MSQGDILGDDKFHRNPFGSPHLGGEHEIQSISRVVLDDEHRAGGPAAA